ncbi:MAG TPA: ABC transporter permease [Candidatus Polarisedimenticolia bacterium]|jgi:predicted permease|nr:ABC transporter permease [Candidatus Polarisedimenticolia bacterium]
MLDDFMTELRQSARSLARTPSVTFASIACLATAIGASVAVFTIVNGVVLRTLPFPRADRLVGIWGVAPGRDTVRRAFSWPDVRDIAGIGRSLEAVVAVQNTGTGMTLTGQDDPVQVPMRIVSGNFFDVLGVSAAIGRTLTTVDDDPASPPSVVMSDGFWRRRFGADPTVVGRSLTLDGRAFLLAGVAPRWFAYPAGTDLWVTVAHAVPEYVEERGAGWMEMIGRMKKGVTPDGVRADLSTPVDEIARKFHPARGREELSVMPLARELLGDTRPALWALLAAVLVLLAVACTNVGGLLLVRGAARARDVAMRVALGAERSHLVRQAFAESSLLVAASGTLGLLLAIGLVEVAKLWGPADIPRLADVGVDGRVLAFALGLVSIVTVLCALIPALQATTADVQTVLKRGGGALSGDRAVLRRVLVSGEIALSVVLIVAAGLVGRSFLKLRAVDVGFRADRVLAFAVPQPPSRYPKAEDSLRFADRLLPRLATLPGVRRTAAVLLRPFWGTVGMDWSVIIEGQSPADARRNPLTNLEAISPGYFATLGIPLLEGRDIHADDRDGRPGVAVVGRSFARRFWPEGPVLGRRLQFPLPGSPYDKQWFTVVGIVGDAKYRGLRDPRLDLYISSAQCPYPVQTFVLRADGDPGTLAAAIRAEVRAIDRDLPIDDVVVLSDAVSQEVEHPRFTAAVFGLFATTATALAALGLGTIISWQVRQRTREIGIRVALGASSRQVMGLVMHDAALLVAGGVVAGVLAAVATTRFLRALLFEVEPGDPVSLAAAALVVASVGLISAYVPARRTSRVDPLIALREE